MPDGERRMIFLGFGKYVRSDRIYALEPIRGEERGGGKRTRVWVEGIPEPIVASRTERSILLGMGESEALATPVLEEALALAERVLREADKAGPLLRRSIRSEAGVDLEELGRRARRLLEASAREPQPETLFETE